MSFRPSPKYASKNAKAGAWTTCDDCGFIDNQSRMQFQYDYLGGSVPQNTGYLVCRRCLNDLNFQRKLIVIPPDPSPIFNTRPENYVVDETNWLVTQDAVIIDTQDGEDFITSLPNPSTQAVQFENPVVEEAAVNITTEDGLEIVTESGEGNPIDLDPNP